MMRGRRKDGWGGEERGGGEGEKGEEKGRGGRRSRWRRK